MDNRPIGFFDSGLGGLTCVLELQKRLPSETVVYFGDTARTPYGSKSSASIERFAKEICDMLVGHDVKMIAIACNTVSAVCAETLQRRYPDIPVIGIIAPTARRVAQSVTEPTNIGVIGTKATVKSGVYESLIHKMNPLAKTSSTACPLFVPMIEEGLDERPIIDLMVRHYLDDFVRQNEIQKLILGCTHYPFYAENITEAYPHLELIDPARSLVDEIEQTLRDRDELAEPNGQMHRCYASDLSGNFERMINRVFENSDSVRIKFHRFSD